MIESGAWKNFNEIEEHLSLDELLMLSESVSKKIKMQFRVAAAAQGVEIPEDEEDSSEDDLPEELLEAERALAKKRQEQLEPGEDLVELGFGYTQASN